MFSQKEKNRVFLAAAYNNHIERLRNIINEEDIDINYVDENGHSALMLAMNNDFRTERNIETIDLLIEKGCDVTTRSKKGDMAIHLACRNGLSDVAAAILTKNPAVIHTLSSGFSPLHLAIYNGNTDTAKLLISHDISILNQKNSNDLSPLMIALARAIGTNITSDSLKDQCKDFATYLLRDHLCYIKSDINEPNNKGNTALHIAAYLGDSAIVESILKIGAETTIENNNGKTAHDLARSANIKSLIEVGNTIEEMVGRVEQATAEPLLKRSRIHE